MPAIIRALDGIADADSETDLLLLEGALEALKDLSDAVPCTASLLAVFERFPWSDGYGAFWSILHALEELPAYEPLLVASVRREPGEFNLMMVNRLLNSGVSSADGVSLLELLDEVARDPSYSERARSQAREYFDCQYSDGPGEAAS